MTTWQRLLWMQTLLFQKNYFWFSWLNFMVGPLPHSRRFLLASAMTILQIDFPQEQDWKHLTQQPKDFNIQQRHVIELQMTRSFSNFVQNHKNFWHNTLSYRVSHIEECKVNLLWHIICKLDFVGRFWNSEICTFMVFENLNIHTS